MAEARSMLSRTEEALLEMLEATGRLTCDDIRMYLLPVDTQKFTLARLHAISALSELERERFGGAASECSYPTTNGENHPDTEESR